METITIPRIESISKVDRIRLTLMLDEHEVQDEALSELVLTGERKDIADRLDSPGMESFVKIGLARAAFNRDFNHNRF